MERSLIFMECLGYVKHVFYDVTDVFRVTENASKFSIGILRLSANELEGVACSQCCKFRRKVCCLHARTNSVPCPLNVSNTTDSSRFVCAIM